MLAKAPCGIVGSTRAENQSVIASGLRRTLCRRIFVCGDSVTQGSLRVVVVGIHQLHYLPWLRYFHKIECSDVFVILDDIQYNKNGYQNRNRIKTPQGDLMLTVPVFDRFAQSLDSVRIDNKRNWAAKHWRSIEQSYRRAPYFERYAPVLSAFYQRPWETLNELNRPMLA
jgi:hypothetical protein